MRELREKAGLSQAQLGNKLGTDGNTVSRWERGKLGISQKNLRIISETFNTTVSYLLDGIPPPREAIVNMDEAIYPTEWVNVPVYDIRTCAGYGTSHLFEDVEVMYELPLPAIWVGSVSQDPTRKPFLTRIDGDSMSAAGLQNGMLAAVNPNEEVYSGQAALVCFGENRETAIKRVYYLPDGSVELRSATPGFPVTTYTKEQKEYEDAPLIIIGRVMGAWTEPTRG